MPDPRMLPLLLFGALAAHFVRLAASPSARRRTRWGWGRNGGQPASALGFAAWASMHASIAVLLGYEWSGVPAPLGWWVAVSGAMLPVAGMIDAVRNRRREAAHR